MAKQVERPQLLHVTSRLQVPINGGSLELLGK